jgi:CubicO group peptidase (beta-lactamase class C family)
MYARHIAALLFAFTPRPARAQAAPVTPPPADSIIRAAVAVIQQGDAAARGALLATALSAPAHKDSATFDRLLTRLHDQGAPYEQLGVRRSGRHAFVQLRSARAQRTLSLQLSTDRADTTHLGTIDILEAHHTVLDSITWPAEKLATDAELARRVDANLTRLMKAGAFSGTVHIVHDDKVVLSRGYGLANREDSTPAGPHTRYAMASMGKMFTAVAVLQLVDAGKLRLDDTLARVLPAYPNAERAARITIRQLLEHSAGLGDQWSTPRKPVTGLTGHLATAAAVAYPPLLFEPGTRWSYSNEGYTVLGAVIEQVTGETYQQYVQRHVLDVAGMHETVMAGSIDERVPFRAVGYRPRADDPLGIASPLANWSFVGTGSAGGAGGGYSTVGDLTRFGQALRDGRLVSAASREAMWNAHWDIPGYDGEQYGFGSFVRRVGDRRVVGHGGGGTGSGMDNGFRHFTDGSWTVVVLTNIDPPTATNLTTALVKMLVAQPATTRVKAHSQ